MKNYKAIVAAVMIGICPAAWAQYSAGTNALANTNINTALTDLTSAASAANPNAEVYLALTRLLAIPTQPTGAAFLTRLGFSATGRNVYHWQAKPTKNSGGGLVVANNLDANEFTAELRNDFIPTMIAAEANLAQVTNTAFTLPLPRTVTHFADVTIDYGDVQMLRAILDATTVFGYTLHSWNLDAQFGAVSNIVAGKKSVEDILTTFPSLLTIANPSDLTAARSAFTNAIQNYFAASQFIRNRPQGGPRRLFNLDASDFDGEQNFRTFLADLQSSVNGPFGGPGADAGAIPNAAFSGAISGFTNRILSLSNFFNGQFSVRSMLPALTTNQFTFIWDSFPDTTLGGVLTGLTETNLGKLFIKQFHAQALLNYPGVTYSVLCSASSNLQNSLNGVILGADGNLYGTSPYGGAAGNGAFYRATQSGTFTLLYSFGTRTNSDGTPLDGAGPSGLVMGRDGNFYGTTQWGTTNYNGAIFRLTPSGQFTNLYLFGQATDGQSGGGNPMTLGSDGKLYGTTPFGGDIGSGTIFQFNPSASSSPFTLLYSLDGSSSEAGTLVQGSDGYFYGVSQSGGTYSGGSIFQFIPATAVAGAQLNTLYSFPRGQGPNGYPNYIGINPLVLGADGKLYGTTQSGGNNDVYYFNPNSGYNGGGDGSIFCIDTNGNFTPLYSFDQNGFDGFAPTGALVQRTDGVFVGMTASGGANGRGTIFGFYPGGAPRFVVWFAEGLGAQQGGQNGDYGMYYTSSQSGLIKGVVSGVAHIFGTTPYGGTYGNGTVFMLGTNSPAVIVSAPADTNGVAGGSVTLSVSAGGAGPLSYHWVRVGGPLPGNVTGANSAALTFANVSPADAGSYYVVVSNAYYAASSTPSSLAVFSKPSITSQPAAAVAFPQGQALNLTVAATGTAPLSYQWFANGAMLADVGNISGSATSSLVISPTYGANSGSYSVVVTNLYGSATSRVSVVTVGVAPGIAAFPGNTTNLLGSNLVLRAMVSGTAPLSYQWVKNGTNRLSGSSAHPTGANNTNLTFTGLTLADAGSYSMIVTNAYGSATSTVAALTVVAAPAINSQPSTPVSIVQGESFSLKVGATGTPPLFYQWLSNNVSISDVAGIITGSATSNLVINPAVTNYTASYVVVITNAYAAVTSRVSVVTVAVDRGAPIVTIQRPLAGVRAAAPFTFSGQASEVLSLGNVPITNVTYWITNYNGANSSPVVSNNAVLSAGLTASAPSNWTVTVSLPVGSNAFAVQSRNFSGTASPITSVKYFLSSPNPLTVITNAGTGNGSARVTATVAGESISAANPMLNVGEGYTILASPGANSFFSNWVGGVSQPYAVLSTNPSYSFTMQSNLVLQANFITNIFVGMAGNYTGLFTSEAMMGSSDSSGLVSLKVDQTGAFSGSFWLNAPNVSFSGTFAHDGSTTIPVTYAQGKATVVLYLGSTISPRSFYGSVNGTNTTRINGGWMSYLSLVASLSNTRGFASNYTALIPPAIQSVGAAPAGDGFALFANNPGTAAVLPMLTITGQLADGATIVQTVPIGEDSGVPVYLYPNGTSTYGVLFGKLYLSSQQGYAVNPPWGDLTWVKKAATTGLFRPGFTNQYLDVQGSVWSNSVPITNVVLTNSQLVLSGGGLLVNTTNYVWVSKTNLVRSGTTNVVLGTINTNTGQYTLNLTNSGVRVTGQGAVLQTNLMGDGGGGYFLIPSASPTNAGSSALLPPAPPAAGLGQ